MEYAWIDEAALKYKGAEKDYKAEWGVYRYLVGNKMFGMLGKHKDGRPLLTLKLLPADGLLLRARFPHIIPGYYMNKEHWNSIYLDGKVPREVVERMIGESYKLILAGLPKKTQTEISGK